MAQTAEVQREEFSIDEFTNCFIASLRCQGKEVIWIRGGDQWIGERDRMHRLYRFLGHAVTIALRQGARKKNKDFLYFLVRLRNQISPSNIGSFEGTLGLFRNKLLTWTSQNPPFYEYYKLDVSVTTARWHLNHAPSCMKRLGEAAAKQYMKPVREWRHR